VATWKSWRRRDCISKFSLASPKLGNDLYQKSPAFVGSVLRRTGNISSLIGNLFSSLSPPPLRFVRRKITVFSTTLAAFTIDHGESKSLGPDLLVSYHDNDHYNSVRDRKCPPKPAAQNEKKMPSRKASNGVNNHQETPIEGGGAAVAGAGGDNFDPKQPPQDPDGTRLDDPADDYSAATASVSALSIDGTTTRGGTTAAAAAAKDDKSSSVKKGSPCPCGSGVKYRKCCYASKQKRSGRSDKKQLKRMSTNESDDNNTPKDSDPEEPKERSKSRGQFQVVSI
jgi:SEC-C motif